MKRFLIAAAVLVVVISAASCKNAQPVNMNTFAPDTVVVDFPQVCGKSSEIKDFKAEKEAEAMRHGAELQCDDSK